MKRSQKFLSALLLGGTLSLTGAAIPLFAAAQATQVTPVPGNGVDGATPSSLAVRTRDGEVRKENRNLVAPDGKVLATLAPAKAAGIAGTPMRAGAAKDSSGTAGGLTGLYFKSNTGDWVGAGMTKSYSAPDYAISVQGNDNYFYFDIKADVPEWYRQDYWTLTIAGPGTHPLVAGGFEGAARAAFRGTSPGLDFYGSGRGCNEVAGRFSVLEIERAPDGTITRFAADFIQFCERFSPPLIGEIRMNSTVPFSYSAPAGDATPDPFALKLPTLADPAALVTSLQTIVYGINVPVDITVANAEYSINDAPYTSAPGTVANLDKVRVRVLSSATPGGTISPSLTIGGLTANATVTTYAPGMALSGLRMNGLPGDYVGAGAKRLFISPEDIIAVSGTATNFGFSASGRDGIGYSFYAGAPTGETLTAGTYENTARFAGVDTAGMDISGDGRGCNQSRGRMVIRELSFNGSGAIDKLAIDFEQHCELTMPALYGEVRFNSSIPFTSLSQDVLFGVAIKKVGKGSGTVSGSGGEFSCGPVCLVYLPETYVLGMTAAADAGSVFKGWENFECSGSGGCTIRVGSDGPIVTARFEIPTKLTVTTSGIFNGSIYSSPAGIFCPSTCAYSFDRDALVTLYANPYYGTVFTGWSGGGCSGRGSCTVTMSQATTVTANFVSGYAVSVSLQNQGGTGRVTSSPPGIDCGTACFAAVTNVFDLTMTATPDPGSRFVGWSGSCSGSGSNPTCIVSTNNASNIIAVFQPVPHTVTVSKMGPGSGTISSNTGTISCGATCQGLFNPAAGLQLTATADPGSSFTGWSGACSGTGTCTVSANADVTVYAYFNYYAVPQGPQITSAVAGDGLVAINYAVSPVSTGVNPTSFTLMCNPGGYGLGYIRSSPAILRGLTNGVTYTCSIRAESALGSSAESAPVQVTPTAAGPLTLLSMASRKQHGTAGTFLIPIDLSPVSGSVTDEPRQAGAGHEIVFEFSKPVTSIGSVSTADMLSNPVGTGTYMTQGNSVLVTLKDIPDRQRLAILLNGVNGELDVSQVMGFLLGDVNNSRGVSATDILSAKRRAGQAVNLGNFRSDINLNGVIDAQDAQIIRTKTGGMLPD